MCIFFFFKQKTAYEMRISDWSSDVCSSDLVGDRNQLDSLARRLEQGRRGFADGHENLVAIVRFGGAHVRRAGGNALGKVRRRRPAPQALGLAVPLHPAHLTAGTRRDAARALLRLIAGYGAARACRKREVW